MWVMVLTLKAKQFFITCSKLNIKIVLSVIKIKQINYNPFSKTTFFKNDSEKNTYVVN